VSGATYQQNHTLADSLTSHTIQFGVPNANGTIRPITFAGSVVSAFEIGGAVVRSAWRRLCWWGAIGPRSRAARRFGSFGANSIICFPANTILNEQYIRIGEATMIGPQVTLSAGMMPGQQCLTDSVVRIGNRCLIGKGSGIVGHLSIDIGDDVWTGHHVYITDQNHGYEDIARPIAQQVMPELPVVIGEGSWLGFGTVVLPGARIGRHVTVGANSVVTGELPDFCMAAGAPAAVIRRYVDGQGWVRVEH